MHGCVDNDHAARREDGEREGKRNFPVLLFALSRLMDWEAEAERKDEDDDRKSFLPSYFFLSLSLQLTFSSLPYSF